MAWAEESNEGQSNAVGWMGGLWLGRSQSVHTDRTVVHRAGSEDRFRKRANRRNERLHSNDLGIAPPFRL